jgi:acyl transferase domain-containing protein/NADPH:quinone reductase-like Zn-dependent oxidoreductase/acyl carrier protein
VGNNSSEFQTSNSELLCDTHKLKPEAYRPLHLLTLSAKTARSLQQLATRYEQYLTTNPTLSLGDVCFSANTGRSHFEHRLGIVTNSVIQAREKLAEFTKQQESVGIFTGIASTQGRPKIAFLFTGQGSQYLNMGQELYETEAVFTEEFERCCELLKPHLGLDLRQIIYPNKTNSEVGIRNSELRIPNLNDTAFTQSALFALEYALYKLWTSWGIQPDIVMGHSLGEYVAACVAGVFSLEDALLLVATRARLMQALPQNGQMVVVAASESLVASIIEPYTDKVAIAALNSPKNTVISGEQATIAQIVDIFSDLKIATNPLKVSHAFHSPLMQPMLAEFNSVANSILYASPQLEMISNRTGSLAGDEVATPQHWCKHILETVRFSDGMQTLAQQGCNICIEIGSKPTLLRLGRACLPESSMLWLPSLESEQKQNSELGISPAQTLLQQSSKFPTSDLLIPNSDWQVMLSSLAKLYVHGVAINWQALEQDYQRHRVLLPNYAFERQRYWIEVAQAKSSRADNILHPLLGKKLNIAKSAAIHFENQISKISPAYLEDHQVFETTIFPAAGYLEMALAAGSLLLGTDALVIEDVEIQQALVLESEAKTIQMVLFGVDPNKQKNRPDAENAEEEEEEGEIFPVQTDLILEQGYTFEVLSLVSGDEEKWVLHATGKVRVNNDIQNVPTTDLAIQRVQYEQANVPAVYYQALQERGIDYGESFSAIAQLFTKPNQALGQIQLPKQFTNNTYKIHPVLLDAALQVIGAALHSQVSEIYLPVGLERFSYYGNAGDCLWSSVQVHKVQTLSRELLTADVQLIAPNGQLIASVSGLKLRKTNPKAMFGGEPESFQDWLYTVEWREQGAVTQPLPDYLPSPEVVRSVVVPTLDRLLAQVELQVYRELLPQLEQLSIGYVLKAFESLNWQFLCHQRFSTEQVIQDLAIAPQHHQLCDRLLQMLMEAGILQQQDNDWQVVQLPHKTDPETQQQSILTQYPIAHAELTLLHRCGMSLAQVLQGKIEPLQLLFPQGDTTTLTQLYQDSTGAKLMNTLVQQVVQFALEHKPQHRRVRILEIGAGTGGTTAYLLPHLEPGVTEYTFSDISGLFIHKAQQKFQEYTFVEYMVLDISLSPQSQGLDLQHYDIIIAANVLHATSTLHQTLTHVQQLLSPGGMLVLLEGIQPLRWLDLIFGLTEGWWRFTDRDLRPSHPLLSVAGWQQLLLSCGFEQVAAIEPEQQAVIVAQTSGIGIPNSGFRIQDSEFRIPNSELLIPNSLQWIILSDRLGLGQELAKLLQAQGQNCILVFPGQDYQQLDEQRYQINPMHQTEFQLVLERVTKSAPVQIVHLWSLDTPAAEGLSGEHLNAICAPRSSVCAAPPKGLAIAKLTCGSALNLVQSLVKTTHSPSSLWFVTQGAVSIAATDKESGIMQSPLWGLGKVIALEHPELGGFRVDLDPTLPLTEQASILLAEILSDPKEDQVAFRNQIRYVPRLVNSSQKNLHRPNLLEMPESQPFRLGISTRGTIENLQLQPMQRRSPQVGEVEIQISATGLNFIDVLDALNLLPFERNWFGVECAGEIVAVGEGVEHFKPGDAVIALAPESLSQFVTTNAAMVILKPKILSFEEAATIPANFLTAYYALHQVANISRGDSILIHAAAGGTGMAAVQLAQQAGAEVFATASPSKWEKLKAMGVKHLFNSRTLDFAEGVMALTQGEGVDIVLNSLSGDFIAKSFSVLKNQGRFLEIGKRDVWSHTQVKQLQKNVSYALVDLMSVAQQQPDLIQSMLRHLMQLFQTNQLQPLPRTVFPIQQAIHAFRYMQQAKHIGKVVISNNSEFSIPNSFNGTYLITGGLGGLGLLVADWLVQQGARHLVLVSRRAADAEINQRLQSLKQAGAEVMVVQADVADESQLANVLSTIKSSVPPLRGVIHAAGVLDDGVLRHLTWERFATVLHPKMLGAWNLHNLTQEQPLDFFVLFSSAASLLGSPGQANHVAANTFLDALAHYRQARGLPGLSINWGAWASVGAAAKRGVSEQMRLRGVAEIAPHQGLQIFAQLLNQNAAQVGVIPINWSTFLQQSILSPFFADFQHEKRPKSSQQSQLLQQLGKVNISDRPAMLMAYLQTEVAKVLGLPSTQLPALKQGFFDLGMDSLMTVELKNRLETSLGISIPSTVIFEYPTIQDLGEYLEREVFKSEFGIRNSEFGGRNSPENDTATLNSEFGGRNSKENDTASLNSEFGGRNSSENDTVTLYSKLTNANSQDAEILEELEVLETLLRKRN